MKRQCLEKWNNQTVLVLGHIDCKKHNDQGQLHLCLKDCQVALYGEGKPTAIDHVWIFTDLKEEELAFFDSDEDTPKITPFSFSDQTYNIVPIVGKIHPYWRKSIKCLDYGIQYLNIYHGELNNIYLLIKQYNELIKVEKTLVFPLLQRKRQEIKANHRFFSQLLAQYKRFLYQSDITIQDGSKVALKEYILELENRLKEQRLVFPPEKTSTEMTEVIQTLKTCYTKAEEFYQGHLRNAPKFPKKTIPKTAVGFGKF